MYAQRNPWILFLWFSFATVGAAQTRLLTLDDAVRLGMEQSRQLKLSNSKLEVARLKIKQYWLALVPNVTVNSAYSRLSDNIEPYKFRIPVNGTVLEQTFNPQVLNQFSNKLSVQQVLFSGFRVINFYKSAEILEKAVALDVEKEKVDVKNNIIIAVLNLYKIQQTRRALDSQIYVLKNRQNDVKNFVKQGTVLENDWLKVDLALTQVETAQQELDHHIAIAQFALATLLGLPDSETVVLDEKSLFVTHEPLDLNAYLNAAASARLDLAALEQRRLVSNKMLDIAKGGNMPTISAGANAYYNNPNQRVFPQTDAFKGTWDIGLSLSWNLTTLYTNPLLVQEAQINVAQVGLQREQLNEGVRTEVATAFYNFKTGVSKAAFSQKSIAQAIENQRITKNRYAAQVAPLSELLEADFLLFQNLIYDIAGKTETEIAYYKLMKAVGK
jgi:outer membrane protein TolC